MTSKKRTLTTSESDLSHEIERDVQSCTQSTYKLVRPQQPKRVVSDCVANILSYMGKRNPWPQPVTKDDELWLLDNTAFPSTRKNRRGKGSTEWEAEFVTAVFSQEPSCVVSDVVVEMAEKIGLADNEEAKKTIETRLRPFLLDIQPGKQVLALHGGDSLLVLGPGGRNGISSDLKSINAAPAGMTIPTTAEVPESTTGLLQSKTFFAEAEGWAVISDVDDTIKSQITSASPFFYLSASPYNLYPFLREFRNNYFPHGQLILRDASWMSLPGLISTFTLGTQEYKTDRIKKIYQWLPRKKFIVVGDSTQTDPEAYSEAYRTYGPKWIRLILIRKVTGVATIGIDEKNKAERFEKAFEGVPRNVWHVFEEPAECYQLIRDAVKAAEETVLYPK
ncbi:hypothetical protein N0V93_007023 [Gnomoniopsis smithogilvyi]|uniref:Phosphatidate phosphatase APP1 catalytic domain-containing protein n=1 Tax=Gnomoniopsis smithogilvyi TaxID=1191159 RepID=A0A9W9CUZ9_9PEZI|nr:hypothetical protein N0V93_007023 [Gnomoniopsis smithogilvyi]